VDRPATNLATVDLHGSHRRKRHGSRGMAGGRALLDGEAIIGDLFLSGLGAPCRWVVGATRFHL